MDVGGIVQWSPRALAVAALLGLSGCLPADRGWVQEQLAPVQVQMAEVRDRVVVVEEQVRRLDPKVDHILTQMEQQWQLSIQLAHALQFRSLSQARFPKACRPRPASI